MQVHVEIGSQPLPVRMRLGAMRQRGMRALPLRMPGVMRVMSVAMLGLHLLRIRRDAPKATTGEPAVGD